jgi:hypothetical protein
MSSGCAHRPRRDAECQLPSRFPPGGRPTALAQGRARPPLGRAVKLRPQLRHLGPFKVDLPGPTAPPEHAHQCRNGRHVGSAGGYPDSGGQGRDGAGAHRPIRRAADVVNPDGLRRTRSGAGVDGHRAGLPAAIGTAPARPCGRSLVQQRRWHRALRRSRLRQPGLHWDPDRFAPHGTSRLGRGPACEADADDGHEKDQQSGNDMPPNRSCSDSAMAHQTGADMECSTGQHSGRMRILPYRHGPWPVSRQGGPRQRAFVVLATGRPETKGREAGRHTDPAVDRLGEDGTPWPRCRPRPGIGGCPATAVTAAHRAWSARGGARASGSSPDRAFPRFARRRAGAERLLARPKDGQVLRHRSSSARVAALHSLRLEVG